MARVLFVQCEEGKHDECFVVDAPECCECNCPCHK